MRSVLALLLLAALLCGCAGRGDWDATLVENYAVWRLNGYQIVLVREDDQGSGGQIVIDTYLYRVTWNQDFICVQRTDPPEDGLWFPIVPEVDYYILRVSDGKVFGPCTAAEYEAQCEALGVSDLPDWIYVTDLAKVR